MKPGVFQPKPEDIRQQLRMEIYQSHRLFAHGRDARVPPLFKPSQSINIHWGFYSFSFGHARNLQTRWRRYVNSVTL